MPVEPLRILTQTYIHFYLSAPLLEASQMNIRDRIEDIEQRIAMAYEEGNYLEAKSLENQIKKTRGQRNLFDEKEPYSIEGRIFIDNE